MTGVEAIARQLSEGPTHFTATVGEFAIEPNAANVVPSRARLLIDARAEDRARMERFLDAVGALAGEVAAETGAEIAPPKVISDNPRRPPTAFSSMPSTRPALSSAPDVGPWRLVPGTMRPGWRGSRARP